MDIFLKVIHETSYNSNNKYGDIMKDIGNQLLSYIEEKDYTQTSFAKKMNISPSTLNKYIQNKRQIPLDILVSFSKELDFSVDVLIGLVRQNDLSLNKNKKYAIKKLQKIKAQKGEKVYQSILNLIDVIF